MNQERKKITVEGAVQGVGFRPFIYNLAIKYHLLGYVTNTSNAVIIEIQGDPKSLENFINEIRDNLPPLARAVIASIESLPNEQEENSFEIRPSQEGTKQFPAITPDAATCRDCLRELFDPGERRYRYPFINCTNCGPRYTIIADVPYDRHNTTMRSFKMCQKCQEEYDDPANRRFHAQPNACPICGPHLWLTDNRGNELTCDDVIAKTISLLETGKIVALKGLGGYLLAVRADSEGGLQQLRQRKYRKAKALAVMVRDIEAARQIAEINPTTEELLTGVEKPIVLCPKKTGGVLSEEVAPASRFWGIMLPYTPMHSLIMEGAYPALVMTSGNNTDDPIEKDNSQALKHLEGIADYFLMHDRDIYTSCDDSVTKIFQGRPLILRRARGYVPRPIKCNRNWDGDILAVGAELKNTITYLKAEQGFVSQHIGNLIGSATYESFQQTIEKIGSLIDAKPEVIVCDLHPGMLSTRFARQYRGAKLIQVQHHHAHIAAVMGEHNLEGKVVGLAVDGFGYGSDGTVWGCELLEVQRNRFVRRGHLEAVPQPGGDAAARQGWRMAVSYLINSFGAQKGVELAKKYLADIDQAQIEGVAEMIEKQLNSPITTSLGRFFDGVSALLGICNSNSYEAQGAIEMENAVKESVNESYPVQIDTDNDMLILAGQPVVQGIIQDLASGVDRGIIAERFHNFVARGLAGLAGELAERLKIKIICLAGGVFQNDIILCRLVKKLESSGLKVYYNQELPLNDGSISFGQAVVADALLGQGEE